MSDWLNVFFAGLFVIVIIRAAIVEDRLKGDMQHWQLVASSLATRLESMGAKVIIDRERGGSGVTILWPDEGEGVDEESPPCE